MDTLQFAKKVFPDLKNHKLTTLVKKFNLSKNDHRALEDCISTKKLYNLIKKQCGLLEKMTKTEVQQLVVDAGSILDNSVTKKTNILILGSTEQNSILKGKKSVKQIKAEKYIQEGQDLEIIDEFTFYNIMDV